MLPNGVVAKQTSRVFADRGGPEPGVPDGIKVDSAGNVYSGGAGGLYILDVKGKKLGRIVHGEAATTNLAFGGDDWKTLYFTTRLNGRGHARRHTAGPIGPSTIERSNFCSGRRVVLTVGLDLDARLVSRTTLPNSATGSSHLQMISASAP